MLLARKPIVLVVDDDPWIHRHVELKLRADGFLMYSKLDSRDVVRTAKEVRPDVILLDIGLPDVDGFQVCEQLKSDPSTMLIPIVFLTGQDKTEDKVRGLDLGAADYIMKPFDPIELCARVRGAARTKYLLDLLEHRAQIDGLTGLHNRMYFDKRLGQEIERSRRYGKPVSLIMADADHFKEINDQFGHYVGDRVLCEMADAIRKSARSCDLVARYGGEEFVVILPEQDVFAAVNVAERIRSNISHLKFQYGGSTISFTSSFGCASACDLVDLNRESLIGAADRALYSAKQAGRNRVHFWDGFNFLEAPFDVVESNA